MATSIRIVFDSAAIETFLRSPEVQADVNGRADAVAAAAGQGFAVLSTVGDRARAHVHAATSEAIHEEYTHHVLTRAIDAAR